MHGHSCAWPTFHVKNCVHSVPGCSVWRMACLLPAVAVLVSFTGLVSGVQGTCSDRWCLNGATCNANPPGCMCLEGYDGFYCENELTGEEKCKASLCQNGGFCRDDVACSCPNGYMGSFCETKVCESHADCNGGGCANDTSTGKRTCVPCRPGYGGPLCQTPFGELCGRDDGICLNGGTCDTNPERGNFKCTCHTDFAGPLCQVNRICSGVNPCRNDGVCIDGACNCIAHYNGVLCERDCKPTGDDYPCLNGGTCSMRGLCLCPDGYDGPICELEPCSQNRDCLNKGTCNEDGTCKCINSFDGKYCEIACRNDSQCRHGGSCQDPGTCKCVNGYTGSRCLNGPATDLTVVIVIAVFLLVLVLVGVTALLLLRRRRALKRRGALNDKLVLGVRKKSWCNDYSCVVNAKEGPPVARRPDSLHYEPDGKPKEFPRELLHVMEQLGAGSFATVHRAEADGIIEKGTMTTVAIKMLKPMATDGDKRDFDKERNMYLTLGSHPNVVQMLGFCTEKEPFYLIIEYLPNGNLQTYLRHIRTGSKEKYFSLKEAPEEKRNFLLPAEVMSFASQIANGMEFLASKSCIHRDLATRNILLGDELVAKVSDFGLARDIQGSREYEMKSQSRVPVRWMAPESLLDNIYTSKSDVWGFAVLLWELVTLGSHPYPGMSSKQVFDKVCAGYRLPKPESCSEEIYDMMTGCWSKDPEDRPTFTEICKLLDNMMADASGYLIMSELNRDDYLYLEPNQTKSVNTADDF